MGVQRPWLKLSFLSFALPLPSLVPFPIYSPSSIPSLPFPSLSITHACYPIFAKGHTTLTDTMLEKWISLP